MKRKVFNEIYIETCLVSYTRKKYLIFTTPYVYNVNCFINIICSKI